MWNVGHKANRGMSYLQLVLPKTFMSFVVSKIQNNPNPKLPGI